jgi:hypothetical protein
VEAGVDGWDADSELGLILINAHFNPLEAV